MYSSSILFFFAGRISRQDQWTNKLHSWYTIISRKSFKNWNVQIIIHHTVFPHKCWINSFWVNNTTDLCWKLMLQRDSQMLSECLFHNTECLSNNNNRTVYFPQTPLPLPAMLCFPLNRSSMNVLKYIFTYIDCKDHKVLQCKIKSVHNYIANITVSIHIRLVMKYMFSFFFVWNWWKKNINQPCWTPDHQYLPFLYLLCPIALQEALLSTIGYYMYLITFNWTFLMSFTVWIDVTVPRLFI